MPLIRVMKQWAVDVASYSRKERRVGDRAGRLAGGQQDRARGTATVLEITTAPLSGVDADSLECLLRGMAHSFPFDNDLFSVGSGLGPTSFTATMSAVQAKHGGKSASITAASWPVDFVIDPSIWTVAVWRWSGAAWEHYVVRSDGAKWVDRVRNDAAVTTWLTFDTALGVVSLSGSPTFYDNMVVFNSKLSQACVVEVYDAMDAAVFPDPRSLSYDGTIFENSEVKTMRAYGIQRSVVPHSNDSTGSYAWDSRGAVLTFTLDEVVS